MKIRDYAKYVGFEIVGKLTYMGKRGLSTRYYMDENKNLFLIDDMGMIQIRPAKKKPAVNSADSV